MFFFFNMDFCKLLIYLIDQEKFSSIQTLIQVIEKLIWVLTISAQETYTLRVHQPRNTLSRNRNSTTQVNTK